MKFYIGLDRPGDANHFPRACLSIRTLMRRLKPITCPEVLIDSGAFTELDLYGEYRAPVEAYAQALYRLHIRSVAKIAVAVAQDYMCEAFMLERTGLTISVHQRLTIERYDGLISELDRLSDGACPFPVMPVLQGYDPEDYARHLDAYGDRLKPGMWVGVGSVCKRNGTPEAIVKVLWRIRRERPDLQLHGFGVKRTALLHPGVREMLDTADSMAWSYAARKQGRNAHDLNEARSFIERVTAAAIAPPAPWQMPLI